MTPRQNYDAWHGFRREAEQWFQLRLAELKSNNHSEKMISRTLLTSDSTRSR